MTLILRISAVEIGVFGLSGARGKISVHDYSVLAQPC